MIYQLQRYLLLVIRSKKKDASGFTLIELLVSMIVASLVISGLLYLVNELIRIDRREASLENVQRDMQRAMDYMTDELRESVYVYPDPTVVTSRLTDLPSGGTGAVPILAFWKPEFISAEQSNKISKDTYCPSLAKPSDVDDCQALKLRQSYYSLVVYFTLGNTKADNNRNWNGQARIIRYVLPQYKNSVIGTPDQQQTSGYLNPNNDFINWRIPTPGLTYAKTDGDSSVLVDFVDAPTAIHGPLLVEEEAGKKDACNEFGTGYTRSPELKAIKSNSFVACITEPGTATNGNNQEVVVLLRGNAKTAAQEFASPTPVGSVSSQSALPSLKSRVLVRGAANKSPSSN